MSVQKVIQKLHPYERTILPLLSKYSTLSALRKHCNLKDVEIVRGIEWLSNKKIVKTKKSNEEVIVLGKNGKTYKEKGLPEFRFLEELGNNNLIYLTDIGKRAHLSKEEVTVSLGILRRLEFITLKKESNGIVVSLTLQGKNFLHEKSKKNHLHIFLRKEFPIPKKALSKDELHILKKLLSRKDILEVKEEKDRTAVLTELGKKIIKKGVSKADTLGRVTTSLLLDKSWEGKEFRAYDVTINVPQLIPGKKHIVTQAVEYIRRIWLELGFKEMSGRMIETAFWDLDALFVPQDHPAREMQDTFYVDAPAGNLPNVTNKIKAMHEHGGKLGSTGWQTPWRKEDAEQLLLRTHTTVLSAQTLAELKQSDLPAKFFAVGKVFRNEALDWKHLFEFYQVEGIVVDPNANLRHLKGYLKNFYHKMGYNDIRIRPAHFPYTEPSCEVEVLHPVRKEWIELGGCGIFRPEVVVPLLGKDIPVLAWGLGLGRLISSYYNITDIRDLYKNDVKLLREAELWVK